MGLDGTGGSRLARHDMTLEEHAEEDSVDCMIYPNVMFRVQQAIRSCCASWCMSLFRPPTLGPTPAKMPKTNKLTDESTGTSLLYTEKQHQFDSMTPCVRLRALPIDRIRRRCLSARRAASSFSDSRIQRTTAVDPDIDERDISDPTDVASDADDSERRNTERGRPGPCPCPRRRREPYSRFVDVLRETLVPVRGT